MDPNFSATQRHLRWVTAFWWCMVVSAAIVVLDFTPVLWWTGMEQYDPYGDYVLHVPLASFWASAVALMTVINGRFGGLVGNVRRMWTVFAITFAGAMAFGLFLGWGGYYFFFPILPAAGGLFLVLAIYVRWKILRLRRELGQGTAELPA